MSEDVEVCFVCCDEEAVTKCEKCGVPLCDDCSHGDMCWECLELEVVD
jgi:hypothetical protein